MRHQQRKHRVGTTKGHRASLLRNLATNVLMHSKIKTTHAKCLAVRSFVEKLITLAKSDTLASRRLAFSRLGNRAVVQKLFKDVAPTYKDRKGGYLRVTKLADGRVGDNAKMSYIALV